MEVPSWDSRSWVVVVHWHPLSRSSSSMDVVVPDLRYGYRETSHLFVLLGTVEAVVVVVVVVEAVVGVVEAVEGVVGDVGVAEAVAVASVTMVLRVEVVAVPGAVVQNTDLHLVAAHQHYHSH